jgi:hypothetical protein
MTKKNTTSENPRQQVLDLDSRYGEIGIPALAAALRFQSEVKNPAYAPAEPKLDRWRVDLAA